jgi:hypothetical protein
VQQRQHVGVLEQVLDLNRHIVADAGMLRGQPFDDAPGVRGTVEEVGIAKRDVLRAGRDLRPHIVEHHIDREGAEGAAVHRHDRAMAAEVLAAARRLCCTNHTPRAVGHLQRRIPLQRQQRRTIRLNELHPPSRQRRFGETRRRLRRGGALRIRSWDLGFGIWDLGFDEIHQILLGLRSQHMRHASFAQPRGIERCVKSVRDEHCAWIDETHAIDDCGSEPRRRVHGEVYGNDRGLPDRVIRQRLARRVDAPGFDVGAAQPGGR